MNCNDMLKFIGYSYALEVSWVSASAVPWLHLRTDLFQGISQVLYPNG